MHAAMIPLSADEISQQCGASFEDYAEDGLGRAKSAGFLTSSGDQFSVVEYLDGPSKPITYICVLNNPSTMARDLREALGALGVQPGKVIWVDPSVEPEFRGE